MANGGIIGKVNNPTSTTATGVWQQEEQYEAVRDGTWPSRALFTTKSARFNSGSSDSLTRTPSSASNRKTFTYSSWVKRSILTSGDQAIFNAHTDAQNQVDIYFTPADIMQCTIRISNTAANLVTNRVFRDPSAWYHIVLAVDTTQGTAANRMKLYVNGVQETSFSEAGYPNQNTDTAVNNTVQHRIGDSNLETFFNGYIAETILVDGQQLAPTSFGVANSDGVWTPIIYSGTYGTNGFNLQFENAAALGTDSSPNGNTFTVNNLTSIDQSTDYPEVNYATLNSLTKGSDVTLSNGNLTTLGTSNSINGTVGSATIGIPSSGKWYYEIQYVNVIADAYYPKSGLISVEDTQFGRLLNGDAGTAGYTTNSIGFRQNGQKFYNNSASSFGNSVSNGNIVQWYVDMDNGAVYVGINDTVQNSGNPASGASKTGAIWTFTAGTYSALMPSTSDYNGSSMSFNFGSPPYSISSGNADANGYGNFEYAVPSGFYAINTANLAEFG